MRPSRIEWVLVWNSGKAGVWIAEERAATGNGQLHQVTRAKMFSIIRCSYGADGLHSGQNGFVVTRNAFDEIRQFPTLAEAKLYVESIYELEKT